MLDTAVARQPTPRQCTASLTRRCRTRKTISVTARNWVEQFFARLSDEELLHLPYWWKFGQDPQLAPPGDWTLIRLVVGRPWVWQVRALSEGHTEGDGHARQSVGPSWPQQPQTPRDVMIEGESGILACSPPDKPEYNASKRRLTWPNGTVATIFSAEKPDRLRGPQFH